MFGGAKAAISMRGRNILKAARRHSGVVINKGDLISRTKAIMII
jgi:hypothetical protein